MPSIAEQALDWMEQIKHHQVTVVGEDIVDEYIYVRPAGKSAKDSLVTFVRNGCQQWVGGAGLIARHMESLGCDVVLHKSRQPVVKTRYVDPAFNQKLFSVCDRDGVDTMEDEDERRLPGDHVLIADFGHSRGWLPVGPLEYQFISLMVQSNSLNWGFNLITKYACADYIVCDEAELRLATGDRYGNVIDVAEGLALRMKAKLVAVTLGHMGAIIGDLQGKNVWHTFPARARKVVDRMGAGDAFLAASAPLAAMGAPAQVVGLVGSMAAGLHVEKEGNPPLCREELIQRLRELDVPQT